jgi:hypothetical protein
MSKNYIACVKDKANCHVRNNNYGAVNTTGNPRSISVYYDCLKCCYI